MIQVVKIGGNVIDDAEALRHFLQAFSQIQDPKVLVHGGGKLATRLSTRLGIPTQMIEGRRVTDADTLDIAVMTYAGLTNKRIVAALSALHQPAIGLCGADGNAIRSVRRSPEPIDYGFVGDIANDGVNAAFLHTLLREGYTPVLCAITHDAKGQLLNTNADSIASAVAVALSQIAPTTLTFCFEKPGVLQRLDDDQSVIAHIDSASFERLKADGVIAAGMHPKIAGALAAVSHGVSRVVIKSAKDLLDEDAGTVIA
ncbi:MAG: acetylglutamate kinase [Bacteroidaceae bacterium]|nr:acetylglutamate kinase [Bacteroidaceae bacterium]